MMIKVGVKYCGGCNPDYDRSKMVEDLKRRLADKAKFVPIGSEGVDLIMAVEGCKTACAHLSPFEKKRIFVITGMKGIHRFIKLIGELTCSKND